MPVTKRRQHFFERNPSEVAGPLPTRSLKGSEYLATLIADYADYFEVCFILSKGRGKDVVSYTIVLLESIAEI